MRTGERKEDMEEGEREGCDGIFVHGMTMQCCDWCNKKLNGQWLGRRGIAWISRERKEEGEESQHSRDSRRHEEETGGPRWKRGSAT